MRKSFVFTVFHNLALLLMRSGVAVALVPSHEEEEDAVRARCLVEKATWGIASYCAWDVTQTHPLGQVLSFADFNGHLFFYLMGQHKNDTLAFTLTEASLPPFANLAKAGCGPDGKWDAEDPRCAKLTLTGSVRPCLIEQDNYCQEGWDALLKRHPSMKNWPKDHNFRLHTVDLEDIWMIANYGGATIISATQYYNVSNDYFHANSESVPSSSVQTTNTNGLRHHRSGTPQPPNWDEKAKRARWIVANGLWSTVSTISVRLNGAAWGNIRSVVDGNTLSNSTGKPVFYLPTPDETMHDIQKDPTISLTISEASLSPLVSSDGRHVCHGLDPESPLCGRVTITGTATAVTCINELKQVQRAFQLRHPYAPWLSTGAAHTGGAYMTVRLKTVTLLDYFGGAKTVNIQEYLDIKLVDEQTDMPPSTAE